MKNCPYCAEDIQDNAIKCKHCKSMLVDGKSAVRANVSDEIRQPSKQHVKIFKFAILMAITYWVIAIIGMVTSHFLWQPLYKSPSSSEYLLFAIRSVSSVISASLIGLVFKSLIEGFKWKHLFVYMAGSIIIGVALSFLGLLSLSKPIAYLTRSIDPILSGFLIGIIFRTIFDKFSFRYICVLCILLIVLSYMYVLIYEFIPYPYTYPMGDTIRFWINKAIQTCLAAFSGVLMGLGIGILLKKVADKET